MNNDIEKYITSGWLVCKQRGPHERSIYSNQGKWLCFFEKNAINYIIQTSEEAIKTEVTMLTKFTDVRYQDSGVLCIFCDGTNENQHKKILKFMLDKNLIPRNKNGNYRNIAFKFNEQSYNREYKQKFKAKISLSTFVDSKTGKFIK